MSIEAGHRAPDFEAADDAAQVVRLSELLGRPVLIHFFVLAWTGV